MRIFPFSSIYLVMLVIHLKCIQVLFYFYEIIKIYEEKTMRSKIFLSVGITHSVLFKKLLLLLMSFVP